MGHRVWVKLSWKLASEGREAAREAKSTASCTLANRQNAASEPAEATARLHYSTVATLLD